MTLLVTGATGFVGRNLLAASAIAARKPWMTIRRVNDARSFVESRRTIAVDLREPLQFDEAIDMLVHLAAVIPGRDAVSAEQAALANRAIDDQVIEYCCARPEVRLIYFSSSSVYGDLPPPWSGAGEVQPLDAYAREKAASERTIRERLERFDILRLNAPYGPAPTIETVPFRFVQRALRNLPLELFGSGKRQQTFTYVGDIADAVERLLEREPTCETIDLAGSERVSMRRLAETVLLVVSDSQSEIRQLSDVEDPAERIVPDIDTERTLRLIGWRGATTLTDGLSQIAEFLRSQELDREPKEGAKR